MATVYLIRHGWSEGNELRHFCGWTDVELSDMGRQQVKALGLKKPDPVPEILYSSDLRRALDTARILAECWGSELRIEKGFREIRFGAFENRTWDNIQEKYPSQAESWSAGGIEARPPGGGESVLDLAERVLPVFKTCQEEAGDKTWGIVAHGGVIQTLLAAEIAMNPEAYWHFGIKHGSLTRLEYTDAGFAVLKLLSFSG